MANGFNFKIDALKPYMTAQGLDLTKLTADTKTAIDKDAPGLFDFVTNKALDKDGDNILETAEINEIGNLDAVTKTAMTDAITAAAAAPPVTGTPGTTAAAPADPTKTMDPAQTAAFQAELKTAQDLYKQLGENNNDIKTAIENLKKSIDDNQTKIADLIDQANLVAKNGEKLTKDAINKAIADSRAEAEEGKNGDFKTILTSKLGEISSDSSAVNSLLNQASELGGLVNTLGSQIVNLSDLMAGNITKMEDISAKYGALLDTPVENVYKTVSGQIVVGKPGTEGPAATGAEGIAAADMVKFAAMSEDQIATALNDPKYAELVKAAGGDAAAVAKSIKNLASNVELKDAASGTYGTLNVKEQTQNGVTIADLNAQVAKDKPAPTATDKKDDDCCPEPDPYEIIINGEKYIMVQKNDDGVFDQKDILGINDQKNNLLSSLKGLDNVNADGSVSAEELKKNGIELVKVNAQGQFTNETYDLNNVESIKVNQYKDYTGDSSKNNGDTGTFAGFDVKLKDGTAATGVETFEEQSVIDKLFTGVGALAEKAVGFAEKMFGTADISRKADIDGYKEFVKQAAESVDFNGKYSDSIQDFMTKLEKEIADAQRYMDGKPSKSEELKQQEDQEQKKQKASFSLMS